MSSLSQPKDRTGSRSTTSDSSVPSSPLARFPPTSPAMAPSSQSPRNRVMTGNSSNYIYASPTAPASGYGDDPDLEDSPGLRDTFGSSGGSMRGSFMAKGVKQMPHWSPDTLAACESCSEEFTFSRRRHHCRKCGVLVCHSCSGNKLVVPRFGNAPQRVCDNCFSTTIYHPNSPLANGFNDEEEDVVPVVDDRLKVAIAADDSAKIQATIQGISVAMTGNPLGKEIDVRTIYLDSKLSESETISGSRLQNSADTYKYARKIARDVYIEYEQSLGKAPDYGISYELGIENLDGYDYEAFFWIVIYNGSKFGSSRTQSLLLPTSVIANLEAHGMLKKEAENLLFGRPQAVLSRRKSAASNASDVMTAVRSTQSTPPAKENGTLSRPPSDISSVTLPLSPPPVLPTYSQEVVCGVLLNMLRGRMTWAKYMEPSVVLATLPFEWNDMYSVIEL